jgi:uncharacterized membrane protein YsdA (DUF1294 family)
MSRESVPARPSSDATRPSSGSVRPSSGSVRPDRDMSRPLPAALSWSVLLVFTVGFAVAVVVLGIPLWVPAAYGVMSVIAFTVYGFDKSAARRGGQRVSEQTLLTLGLVGGWPGALVAQQLFRHKTRKRSFRRAFWARVVLNVVLLALVIAVTMLWGWDISPALNLLRSLF